ncbi:MAG: hypothetical protein J2P48_18655, partial [Alphaproteobacteria bacterium]|nr:hypothetical protein [Alphaproteobacteria bacterium]
MEARGVHLPAVQSYTPTAWKGNRQLAEDEMNQLAMDSGWYGYGGSLMGHNGGPRMAFDQPYPAGGPPPLWTDPNSGVPMMLTSTIDPDVFRVLFSPNKAAEAMGGEVKRGSWLDDIIFFPVVEATGEVSSYGDYNENGNAGINVAWPARQNYLFQVIKEYGEREVERGGLARINWVSEIDRAAALTIAKFMNLSYLFGIQGLQNYGFANEPNLSPALTPGPKAAGDVRWLINGHFNATANEIYADFVAMFHQLVIQTAGLVETDSELRLLLSPGASVGLTATNSFGVNVGDLLEKNFSNIEIITIPQYAARSEVMPQGVTSGEWMQLMALEIEGQKTAFCAYSEKMRAHPVIRARSSFSQKVSAGTWGTVMRMPAAVVSMVGI